MNRSKQTDRERALELIHRAQAGKGRKDVALVVRFALDNSDLRLALTLTRPCEACNNGMVGLGPHGPIHCSTCNGSGRVRLDAPNRRNIP